jgi:hypothetical protein
MYCEWPMTDMIFDRVPTNESEVKRVGANEELGKTFHESKDGECGDDCEGGESPGTRERGMQCRL